MKRLWGLGLLSVFLLTSGASADSVKVISLKAGTTGIEVSSKYIYQYTKHSRTGDTVQYGEAFKLSVVKQAGIKPETYLICGEAATDSYALENLRRQAQAVAKGVGELSFPSKIDSGPVKMLLKTAVAPDAPLTPAQLKAAADAVGTQASEARTRMVKAARVKLNNSKLHIQAEDILGFEDPAPTTGGSVKIFTIHLKGGEDMNIGAAMNDPKGLKATADLLSKLQELIGTSSTLDAVNVTHQDQIFVVGGTRHGWVANIKDVKVKASRVNNQFKCEDITQISDMTTTTGASVHLFTIKFKAGKDLNIGDAAANPGSYDELVTLKGDLDELRASGGACDIYVRKMTSQDRIFTDAGERSGWVANIRDVSVAEVSN